MHILEDLSYVLEDMIEPIAKKQDISPTELDNVYKAVKTMNYIETIKAMKEYGNSNEGSYARGNSYRGSYNSYEGGNSNRGSYNSYEGNSRDGYSGENSYRRGRDAMGRFTSRDGYSRAEDKQQMISKLEKMMQNASSENERQAIMECIRSMEG